MDDRQRDLDRRIRRAQRREFMRNLWEARALIAIGLVLLVALIGGTVYNSIPPQLDKTIVAHLASEGGVVTTRQGSQYHHETVVLDSGGTITLDIPGSDPVPKDAGIKIDIYRKDFGPLHQVTYRFAGYEGEAAGGT